MLSAVSSQGHAIMTTFMRQLRALAQAFEICILVGAGLASDLGSLLIVD
jgi:undecaprenyl pyrophosphate phosphatase UppP